VINGTVSWECRRHNQHPEECAMPPIAEALIYAAFNTMANKLAGHRTYILAPMLAQLELMQARSSGTQHKVYEIDRQVAGLTDQCHTIAHLHSRGILGAADFAVQTGRVNQQVNALRAERRRLLREDEENDTLADLRILDEALAAVEGTLTAFDETLFTEIVQSITLLSTTELRFRLLGGLELTETIERQKRRCPA